MSNENRTPAGVPTGGQFAASEKSEAGVDLTAPAPRLNAEDTEVLVGDTVGRTGAALQAAVDDMPNGMFFRARAQSHAEAFWLLQRPEVPGVDETANEASGVLLPLVDPTVGSYPTPQAQDDFVSSLGPYVPLDAEHADAIADHFTLQAMRSAAALAAPRRAADPQQWHDGRMMASAEYAVAFRTGQATPDRAAVHALRDHLTARSIAQQTEGIDERAASDADEARQVYDEALGDERTKRADELVVGDTTADGARVTGVWKPYVRDARGWGSVAFDGTRVKMFCAETVAIKAGS